MRSKVTMLRTMELKDEVDLDHITEPLNQTPNDYPPRSSLREKKKSSLISIRVADFSGP